MTKIALVTDSTADLPKDIISRYGINVVPLKTLFGEEEYIDGVDLTPAQFFDKLEQSPVLPTSSQPSPSQFQDTYEGLLKNHDAVVSIHISSALSGTYNSAKLAQQKLSGSIHVIDSSNLTLATGLLVTYAGECIKKGLGLKEMLTQLDAARSSLELFFALDTLKYLTKGGRVGKLAGLAGSVLNIKPIGRVNDEGMLEPFAKARSFSKALDVIRQQLTEISKQKKPLLLAIGHARAEGRAIKLKESLEEILQLKTTVFTEVGSVIGTHAGPGAIGAALLCE